MFGAKARFHDRKCVTHRRVGLERCRELCSLNTPACTRVLRGSSGEICCL